MPRKKKKEKKDRSPFYEEKISDKTKDSFLADIQNLTNKLDYYAEKQKSLLERNEYLKVKLRSVESSERSFLNAHNRALADKGVELERVKEELAELKETKMTEGLKAEKRLQDLKREIQEVKEKLLADNADLAMQLKSLQEFKAHQNEVTSKVTRLKDQLEENKLGHEQTIDMMNKMAAELATQTREEAIERAKMAAEEMQEQRSKEMPELLRRTIRENAAAGSYATFTSGKNDEMRRQNEQMRKTAKQNEKLLEMMEKRERELSRELVSTKRDIRILQESLTMKQPQQKQQQQQQQPSSSSSSLADPSFPYNDDKHFSRLEEDNNKLKEEIHAARREQQEWEETEEVVRLEVDEVMGRLRSLDSSNEANRTILSKAAALIRKFLFEGPMKSPSFASGNLQQEMIVQIHQILKEGSNPHGVHAADGDLDEG